MPCHIDSLPDACASIQGVNGTGSNPEAETGCIASVQMDYEPEGMKESVGSAVGLNSHRSQGRPPIQLATERSAHQMTVARLKGCLDQRPTRHPILGCLIEETNEVPEKIMSRVEVHGGVHQVHNPGTDGTPCPHS